MQSVYDLTESNLFKTNIPQSINEEHKPVLNPVPILLLLAFLFGTPYYLYNNYFNHLDLAHKCLITIDHDVLRGNRSRIKTALQNIKKQNYSDYQIICENVETIYEDSCLVGAKDGFKLENIRTDGCYIKGSRDIIITPTQPGREDTRNLEQTIIFYANRSMEFWKNQPSSQPPADLQ